MVEEFAEMSCANRLKVACFSIKDHVIYTGYNGTPEGWDNSCEGEDGLTLPLVNHAEFNSLARFMRSYETSIGADMFVTHAPCIDCARLIAIGKIHAIYYRHEYRNQEGLLYLAQAKVHVVKLHTDFAV